jgi:hypothetical protein
MRHRHSPRYVFPTTSVSRTLSAPLSPLSATSRACCLLLALLALMSGCATIRTTDPPRTATEQFLLSVAATRAIDQLSASALRGRRIFLDGQYLGTTQFAPENAFLQGELRARLLLAGVQLVSKRDDAEIVLEVRSGGLGIDRLEFLLGIPALYLGGTTSTTPTGQLPVATPELALIKSTRQRGFASVPIGPTPGSWWRHPGRSSGEPSARITGSSAWARGPSETSPPLSGDRCLICSASQG